jgi:hypothetical protein
MKGIKVMKRMMNILVLGALMACLVPAYAQTTQDWQSTSTMPTSGSAYTPQVTSVGAVSVSEMATTTEAYTPAQTSSGPRRTLGHGTDPGSQSEEFPIGDAVLPLMLMVMLFAGVIYFRRRQARA